MKQSMVDPKLFRSVMGRFATGVTIVTTRTGEVIHGMTANAFMSVSLEPPLVLVSVGQRARLHAYLQEASHYGVSILAAHQQRLSDHFAGRTQEAFDPEFVEILGVPLIRGALAHIVAEIAARYPVGDHTLFVGQVLHLAHQPLAPLVYHGGQYCALEQT